MKSASTLKRQSSRCQFSLHHSRHRSVNSNNTGIETASRLIFSKMWVKEYVVFFDFHTSTRAVSASPPPHPLGWVPPQCWASASRAADLPGRWWLWWMPGTHSPHTRYLTPTAGYSSAGCCTRANPVSRADMEHPLRQWSAQVHVFIW